MGRLAGKSAVVTGGARGIGEGIVRRYVMEGARCVIADIDVEAGERLAAELGESVLFLRTDVTSEADVVAAIEACRSHFGALDIMINNAGIVGVLGPIADTSLADYERTMSILLTSVFLGTKHAMAVMKEQGDGVIINTSSTAGVQAGLGPHVYTAAKHGVVGFSKSVALELGSRNIRCNVIAPGVIETEMTAQLDEKVVSEWAAAIPMKRAGKAEEVASVVTFLGSDMSAYISGQVLEVNGAMNT